MASSHLSQASPALPNTAAIVIGGGAMAFATAEMLRPCSTLPFFEFNTASTKQAPIVPETLMRFVGTRDFIIGAVTVGAWYRGDRQLLGFITFMATLVPLLDGLQSPAVVGKGSRIGWRKHFPFVVVMAPLGLALMGVLGQ